MKRMKKRLLAMLMVLMLVVSLLPTGALADGDIWDGYGTFSYHISDSNLQAMVDAYNTTGASSGVDSVSITFDEDYTLGGQKTFLFRNGYTIGLSNTSTSVQPDDIDCLTITLINDTELKVSGDELDWTWVNTYPKRYDLRLKNSEKSTVTFYYQPGDSFTYDEYASVEVDSGTALNDLMPADPTDLGDYKFVGWEIGSDNGDGREFHADTIVSENIAVYARKISVGGGAEVNVINLENSIYSNAYEHFSTEPLEITGIALNGGGKSTNPDYDIDLVGETGVDTGWRDDNSYYYIYNVENHTLPEGGNYWNDRVDPYNLDSITIFTTAGEYNIPRDELDVRVKNDTKVEIYLREATEPETPVEPDPQPDPEPETNPDVRNVSVVVDCKTNDEHDKTVNIIEGSCTFNKAWDEEQWTCTVEISPESYVDGTHTLIPESQTGELLYVYADNSWQYVGGSTPTVTFTVKCETPEQPNVYKINVTVHNGTATFCGSEVTSSILAAEGEDITITFTPDEGYTLDYATIDGGTLLIPDGGVYTLKQVDSDHTIEVFYAKDENGGGEDGDEPDGTPDYRQVFVKYVAGDKNGFVTPSHDTFDLDVDENGKVMTNVALSLNGVATPNADATFAYWTIEGSGYDGGTYSFEADLENENFSGYLPGETYTFTAYFNGPVVKPEEPTVYKINVTVYNGTATFCGSEVTSSILAAEGEDITITFTPDEGYTLDYATIDGGTLLIPDGGVYTLKQVDKDHTIEVFYAEDELGGGDDDDEKPTPPTDEDIIGALDNVNGLVKIDCTATDANHDPETYGIDDLDKSKQKYAFAKNDVTGNAKDGYFTEVTILPWVFIDKYTIDVGNDAHKLDPNNQDFGTISLKWDGSDWVLAVQNQIPVEYTVSCDVETEIVEKPGGGGVVIVPVKPEDPTDPDQTGVSDLLETDDHIQYLFGYPDGSFGPDRNMTRAEAAQMFYNLLKNQNVDAEPAFDDVPEGAWYATPVNVMAELGIVNGVGDDKFEPNREITRAEFTTMAMRFAKVPSGGVNIFTDVAPSDWFYSYVVNSIQYGWIEGYGDGTFRPDRLITRAEVTTIVNRMLDRQADMAYVIQNRDKLTKFTDLTTEHWAYYTIVEATNEHNYKKPAIGEDWTSLIK